MSTVKFNTWQNTDGTENYKCRAWVNFNGTTNTGGNCDIRESGNVSTVADLGTGNYQVNFSTAMPDANYAVTGLAQYQNNGGQTILEGPSDASTSSFEVYTKTNQNATFDTEFVSVAVFR